MIKSKKASFIFFKLCIAVIGTFVLCDSADLPNELPRFFLYYFTI